MRSLPGDTTRILRVAAQLLRVAASKRRAPLTFWRRRAFPTKNVEGGTLLAPTDLRMSSYPTHPPHPERVCWGCDQHCPADDLTCGKDTVRTPHPVELFGDDWNEAESRRDTPDEMTRSRSSGVRPLLRAR